MLESRINDEYFGWMYDKVSGERFADNISFRKLLTYLHDVEFVYTLPMDQNRAEDGIDLRYQFAYEVGYENYMADYITGPCSVLEMMIAVAMHIEEYMDDPLIGDRTGQWFWNMVVSLGLGGMYDTNFNERLAEDVILRFLNRDYEPDGQGGLFTVPRCPYDLRDVEIIVQRNWYLNTIT